MSGRAAVSAAGAFCWLRFVEGRKGAFSQRRWEIGDRQIGTFNVQL
jgi:hypothetical protein